MFFLLWTLIGVGLLSLFPEKKDRYLFPILIPMAPITAYFLMGLENTVKERFQPIKSLGWWIYSIIGLIAVILAVGLYFYGYNQLGCSIQLLLLSISILLAGLCILYFSWKNQFSKSFKCVVTFQIIVFTWGICYATQLLYTNPKYYSITNITHTPYASLPFYSLDSGSPELLFEYQKSIPTKDIETILGEPKNEFLLLQLENSTWEIDTIQGIQYKKIMHFDNNYEPEGNDNYWERKKGIIYLCIKKGEKR